MPENADSETVAQILKRKKGTIKYAPLSPAPPRGETLQVKHGKASSERRGEE